MSETSISLRQLLFSITLPTEEPIILRQYSTEPFWTAKYTDWNWLNAEADNPTTALVNLAALRERGKREAETIKEPTLHG